MFFLIHEHFRAFQVVVITSSSSMVICHLRWMILAFKCFSKFRNKMEDVIVTYLNKNKNEKHLLENQRESSTFIHKIDSLAAS